MVCCVNDDLLHTNNLTGCYDAGPHWTSGSAPATVSIAYADPALARSASRAAQRACDATELAVYFVCGE